MTVVERIMLDEEWNQVMRGIDEMSVAQVGREVDFDCWHGHGHARNVAKLATDFLRQVGASKREVVIGQVAGLVHDMGLINGKKEHDKKGALIVGEFLERIGGLSEEEIGMIVHAVANHSNGEEMGNNLDLAVLIADKMDVARDRVAVGKRGLPRELGKILEVKVRVEEEHMVLSWAVEGEFDFGVIAEWDKMVSVPRRVAEWLGKEFRFEVNGAGVSLEGV